MKRHGQLREINGGVVILKRGLAGEPTDLEEGKHAWMRGGIPGYYTIPAPTGKHACKYIRARESEKILNKREGKGGDRY